MTEPTDATEADRQRQETQLSLGAPELAGEVAPPADDVPAADAIEQQLTAAPGGPAPLRTADPEADEADVLEQQDALPAEGGDIRP